MGPGGSVITWRKIDPRLVHRMRSFRRAVHLGVDEDYRSLRERERGRGPEKVEGNERTAGAKPQEGRAGLLFSAGRLMYGPCPAEEKRTFWGHQRSLKAPSPPKAHTLTRGSRKSARRRTPVIGKPPWILLLGVYDESERVPPMMPFLFLCSRWRKRSKCGRFADAQCRCGKAMGFSGTSGTLYRSGKVYERRVV